MTGRYRPLATSPNWSRWMSPECGACSDSCYWRPDYWKRLWSGLNCLRSIWNSYCADQRRVTDKRRKYCSQRNVDSGSPPAVALWWCGPRSGDIFAGGHWLSHRQTIRNSHITRDTQKRYFLNHAPSAVACTGCGKLPRRCDSTCWAERMEPTQNMAPAERPAFDREDGLETHTFQ